MAGSHTNALAALRENRVDAACASFNVFEKSVQKGFIDPEQVRVLAKSEPIPVPPMGMHVNLDPEIKSLLKEAFNNVHKAPGIKPEQIRGYGGKQIDGFNANYPYSEIVQITEILTLLIDYAALPLVDHNGIRVYQRRVVGKHSVRTECSSSIVANVCMPRL